MDEGKIILEISAPSSAEAVTRGLEQMGVNASQVDVEILDNGSRGLFGIGARPARVRLILKEGEEEAQSSTATPLRDLKLPEPETPVAPPPVKSAPTEHRRFIPPARHTESAIAKDGGELQRQPSPGNTSLREEIKSAHVERPISNRTDSSNRNRPVTTDRSAGKPGERGSFSRGEPGGRPSSGNDRPSYSSSDQSVSRPGERPSYGRSDRPASQGRFDRGQSSYSHYNENNNDTAIADMPLPEMEENVQPGEDRILRVCRQTVSNLLRYMRIQAKVTATYVESDDEDDEKQVYVSVEGEDLSVLIGRRSETLNALQYVAGQIAGKELKNWIPLVIDIQGYRTRRERQLKQIAARMADQAVLTGRKQYLEPMPANERRIIHIALRNHAGVITESAGEEPNRKVTIVPKK